MLAPPRHQTLRASIDWSYNQLTAAESLLLQRLAVFVGGCTLAAAEDLRDGELAEEEVLDVLGRLVDRSLVVNTGGRYGMLETIREYALERLADSGEAEAVHDRHSEYYLSLVKAKDGPLSSQDLKEALVRNGHRHLEHSSGGRVGDRYAPDSSAARVSFPLHSFYEIRCWYREGESIFRDAAARLQKFRRDRS